MTRYVRYRSAAGAAYGIVEGDTVFEIAGGLFGARTRNGERTRTGTHHKLQELHLLYPCEPGKILAVGLNYRSHLGGRPAPANPEMFYKPISALQDPGAPIVIPRDATNVHYEGELVLVIGRTVRNATLEEARAAIFGVTCGNDVSERNWQNGDSKDLQWWRAKGADTFAPLGPMIVAGLDNGNLALQTRLNGEVVQKQSTSDLIFDCPAIVRFVSNWVTLVPGDIIYTGTPGQTRKMSHGDVVEVEIEGIGVLRNPVQ
jgi:2-keto-4-pentenoate hydratase/2-oxohepta-3-ene-1,7-dioic acid hydratase in catechol pathway